MKFALVNGQRKCAEPGLTGECPVCRHVTIAKCGEKNIWHWAHKGKRDCDQWWENETEWHRNWKGLFPTENQEVVHKAQNGEKHIADVKTDQGWVIEFQHSYLNPDERRAREEFYEHLVWVVDGLRRKNDLKQFVEAVKHGVQVSQNPLVVQIHPFECRLVKEWSNSRAPVFLDFENKINLNGLWVQAPLRLEHTAYFALVGKNDFIGWHLNGVFRPQPFFDQIRELIKLRTQAMHVQSTSRNLPKWARRRPSRRF